MNKILETDWIASSPVFYNIASGKASHNINDVIDFANLEFHPEGFNNYLDFGYSVFGQTPIKNVKFLPPCSRLTINHDGGMEIESLEDPVDPWVGRTSNENDVLQNMESAVREWERGVKGDILIPLSGGYDSRLLCLMIQDRSRIRSYTYGLSNDQSKSFEVVRAKKLAALIGVRWKPITLGDYHAYIGEWDQLFGVSTHLHGMYQMEFYKKIYDTGLVGASLLSGLFGDIWAGNMQPQKLSSPGDIIKLGHSHGMRADSSYSLLKSSGLLKEEFWGKYRDRLQDEFYQTLWVIRLKIILITYLLRVPKHYGFRPWSPFLLPEVSLGMLTLPGARRHGRLWQKEYFKSRGVDIESMGLKENRSNTLNRQAMMRCPLEPLDIGLLSQLIEPSYLAWINKKIIQYGRLHYLALQALDIARTSRIVRKFWSAGTGLEAYFAYLTIKPIELLLRKRDAAQL